jgi:putative FmdB family regulatory protein
VRERFSQDLKLLPHPLHYPKDKGALMPIYEYHCPQCDKPFDHLAKSMADRDAPVPCPECHSRKTSRKLSVFAVSGAAAPSGAPAAAHTHSGMCGCGRVPGSCNN